MSTLVRVLDNTNIFYAIIKNRNEFGLILRLAFLIYLYKLWPMNDDKKYFSGNKILWKNPKLKDHLIKYVKENVIIIFLNIL